MPTTPFYCCEGALDEQLFGTAARARVWLLLEYRAAFATEALTASTIPEAVKQRLAQLPGVRVQLIQKPESRRTGPLTGFVAISDPRTPRLYAFEMADYAALLNIDLTAMLEGNPSAAHLLRVEPLIVVCVNGARDIACAKFGRPVYQALLTQQPIPVWQTTHLGGHRFAGTAAILPHGLIYGRLDAASALSISSEHQAGRIALEQYRGLSYYDEVAQAAEYYLRSETGKCEIGEFRLIDAEQVEDGQWRVRFTDRADQPYEVRLARDGSVQTYKNSTDSAPTTVPQFRRAEGKPADD